MTVVIKRDLSESISKIALQFPVIIITGPRQSGKTTLVQNIFPEKAYISLEDLDTREFAEQDPRGFLSQYQDGAILDEVQRVPQLFSYIQGVVDKNQKMGEWILTGSQHFLLMESVSQSLAGRAAVLQLLPFSCKEIGYSGDPFQLIIEGFYPKVRMQKVNFNQWYKNYMKTYIERDVRSLKNISNLSKFQLFLKLCAGRIGQLLNMSSLGSECGIDNTTVRSWLSILEASFVLFLLNPYHKNFNKRLVKQPKLYFYDTGLASYLLGIKNVEEFNLHFAKGALFENFVITEILKANLNAGEEANIFFWRDNHGHEIDLVLEKSNSLMPIEIKSGKTIQNNFFDGLNYWEKLTNQTGYLVCASDSDQARKHKIISWKNAHSLII